MSTSARYIVAKRRSRSSGVLIAMGDSLRSQFQSPCHQSHPACRDTRRVYMSMNVDFHFGLLVSPEALRHLKPRGDHIGDLSGLLVIHSANVPG